MSQTPTPDLPRPLIAGAVLGLVGIVLFIVLYIMLAEAEPVARLLIAVCVPPALISALIGVYILIARPTSD